MNNKDVTLIEDDSFDILLQNDISMLAPEKEIINSINPWKKYMKLVIFGILLSTINNHITFISYIGYILMILGFRGLRNDNKYFLMAYITNFITLTLHSASILINASIWNKNIFAIDFVNTTLLIGALLDIILYLFLWLGIRVIESKANLTTHSKSPLMLFLWRCTIAIFAYSEDITGFPAFVLIVFFLISLEFLRRVYVNLKTTGYVVKPATIRIPTYLFIIIIVLPLIIGFQLIYINNNYPMNWVPYNTEQTAEIESAKSHLHKLGIPAYVTDDLTSEELLQYSKASYAIVEEYDEPLNKGRKVETKQGNTIHINTVYDVKELHFTYIALRMTDDNNNWSIINHFRYNEIIDMSGTDALEIYGDELEDISGEVTGRVLYRKNNKLYTSEYHNLSTELIKNSFFGNSDYSIIGEFSFNRKADSYSGYVTFTIKGEYGTLNAADNKPTIDLGLDYYHQNKKFIYPAITAKDYIIKESANMFSSDDSYSKARFFFTLTPMDINPGY